MKTLHALAPLAFVLFLASPAAAQTPAAAPPADVVGTWDATITTAEAAIPSQIKIRREGDKLVGTISAQMGETTIEAQTKGKGLTIWFNYQGQNGPMAIELSGTVDGDAIKGTMGIGGQPGGEWMATRVKGSTLAAPPATAPAAPVKTDLTGTYNVAVELPNMTASPTLVLKQDGEKLTGEYTSGQYGKFPITGTAKGADVTFWFAMTIEGTALNVTYTGTADKDSALKGSVNYGDMMSGTFTAAKKK